MPGNFRLFSLLLKSVQQTIQSQGLFNCRELNVLKNYCTAFIVTLPKKVNITHKPSTKGQNTRTGTESSPVHSVHNLQVKFLPVIYFFQRFEKCSTHITYLLDGMWVQAAIRGQNNQRIEHQT